MKKEERSSRNGCKLIRSLFLLFLLIVSPKFTSQICPNKERKKRASQDEESLFDSWSLRIDSRINGNTYQNLIYLAHPPASMTLNACHECTAQVIYWRAFSGIRAMQESVLLVAAAVVSTTALTAWQRKMRQAAEAFDYLWGSTVDDNCAQWYNTVQSHLAKSSLLLMEYQIETDTNCDWSCISHWYFFYLVAPVVWRRKSTGFDRQIERICPQDPQGEVFSLSLSPLSIWSAAQDRAGMHPFWTSSYLSPGPLGSDLMGQSAGGKHWSAVLVVSCSILFITIGEWRLNWRVIIPAVDSYI